MAAVDPQVLFDETKCYACYGLSQADLLKLGLLNRIISSGSGGGGGGSATNSWTAIITKSADQSVTNSTTLVNDTELLYPLEANSYYVFEFVLLYSASDPAADYQGGFTYPDVTGSMNPIFYSNNFTIGLVNQIVSGIGDLTALPTGGANTFSLGATSNFLTTMQMRFELRTFAATGNLRWRFANNAAGVGFVSTTKAGSTLFVKKVA